MTKKLGSLQKIFNKAWKHFIVGNGKPAIGSFAGNTCNKCMYLTPEGNKCAIGLCIPNKHKSQHFDGPFEDLILKFPKLFPDLVDYDSNQLHDFQRDLHDQLIYQDIKKWKYSKKERKKRYIKVATKYNLTIPK